MTGKMTTLECANLLGLAPITRTDFEHQGRDSFPASLPGGQEPPDLLTDGSEQAADSQTAPAPDASQPAPTGASNDTRQGREARHPFPRASEVEWEHAPTEARATHEERIDALLKLRNAPHNREKEE